MDQNFRSILSELSNYVPKRNAEQFIESRANHVIASWNNLLHMRNETFSPEEAEELSRRLFNAIKSGDQSKFGRKIRQITESKNKGTS